MSVDLSSITDTHAFDHGSTGEHGTTGIRNRRFFGRAEECLLLSKTFVEVVLTKQRKTICLHGCSGSGKTALIEQFRESLCDMNQGYFCSGKYFQNSGVQEPFSAIMAAFSDLCDLVVQSSDFTEERKVEIRRDLASEAYLLRKVISNLTPFLDEDTLQEAPAGSYFQAGAAIPKFKSACKTFLQTMASSKNPIVVFLDDIQWMDSGSVQLIEMYLNDVELQNIMFILAYRNEEINLVKSSLSNVKKDGIQDISLGNLGLDDVGLLVSDLLQTPRDLIQDLAEIVTKKTEGNAFFVLQFVEAMLRDELLAFNAEEASWKYEIDKIQQELMIADTIADLLLRKIQTLPDEEQDLLTIAALLGYQFDETILFEVWQTVNHNEKPYSLAKAMDFGIIEKTSGGIQFSHDKLQTSFQSMLTAQKGQQLHLTIGETLLAHEGDGHLLYLAAVHFNQSIALIDHDPNQVSRLAQINLDAAKYCKDKSAFDSAVSLLRQGLELLGNEEKWTTDFDLAFELTETLARMELTVGNLDRCKVLLPETLLRATNLEMKIQSLLISVECRMAGNEMTGCVQTATVALEALGIHMPTKIALRHVIWKLLRVRRLLRNKDDNEILQMPHVNDRTMTAVLQLLQNLAFYSVLQREKFPSVYPALLAVELTLKHGLTLHSASSIISYSIVEQHLGQLDRAQRAGRLGLQMLDLFESKETECMAISMWVTTTSHWKEPILASKEPILRAIKSGFLTGDPVYTALAIANAFGIRFYAGEHLSDLQAFMHTTYAQLSDLSHDGAMLLWAQPRYQTVLNLQYEGSASWRQLTVLSGDIMSEPDYMREVAAANHPFLSIIASTFKAQLSYLFGYTKTAEALYKDMSTNLTPKAAFFLSFTALSWYLFGSLTYYERYRETGQSYHLKIARKWQRSLQKIKARGNPNVSFVTILVAEDLSVQNSTTVEAVVAAYDVAIRAMFDEEWVHLEALANEQVGLYLVQHGRLEMARPYLEKALQLYEHEWGATAKYNQLKEQSDALLFEQTEPSQPDVVGEVLRF